MKQIREKLNHLCKGVCVITLCCIISFASIAPDVFYAAQVTEYNTSYYEKNNFSICIQGTNLLLNGVPEYLSNQYLWIQIYSKSSGSIIGETNVLGSSLPATISLSGAADGEYLFYLYYGAQRYGTYNGYWWDEGAPLLKKSGSTVTIELPSGYEQMVSYQESALTSDGVLEYYLQPSYWVNSEDATIRKQALAITSGCKTDYDKLLAIHDWVTENIYYDYDGLYGRSDYVVDATEVLSAKRSVCQGYADLTAALLRSIGIPAKVVSGYAGSPLTNALLTNSTSNHAWNEAYVDGRWIMLDTTWDSGNRYENGAYQKGSTHRMFFDPTAEIFSASHVVKSNEDQQALSYVASQYLKSTKLSKGTIYVGGTKNKSTTIKIVDLSKLPQDVSYEVTYQSSDASVATVSNKGVITAKKAGRCTVYAYVKAGGSTYTYSKEITVKAPFVSITSKTATLSVGKTFSCSAKAYGLKESVVYTSSNPKVATINKSTGKITAVAKGKTVITASCNGYKKTFTLTVK